MRELLIHHMQGMVASLADSSLETTRVYWRRRLGYPEHIVNDPRPLAELT